MNQWGLLVAFIAGAALIYYMIKPAPSPTPSRGYGAALGPQTGSLS